MKITHLGIISLRALMKYLKHIFQNPLKLLAQNFMDVRVLSSAGNYPRYLGQCNFANIKLLSLKDV